MSEKAVKILHKIIKNKYKVLVIYKSKRYNIFVKSDKYRGKVFSFIHSPPVCCLYKSIP